MFEDDDLEDTDLDEPQVEYQDDDPLREQRIQELAERQATSTRTRAREALVKAKESLRDRKRRLVMEGRCPQCACKLPSDSPYNHCDGCRRKAREHMRRKKVGKDMKTEDVAAEIEAALEPIVTKARAAGILVGGNLKIFSRESPQEPWGKQHIRHIVSVSGGAKNNNIIEPVRTEPLHELPEMKSINPAYTGAICSSCQSPRMVQAGKCPVCLDCGSTESCG